LKAINYYIIIDKIKEAAKTVAGLELTETQNTDIRYLKAKVISVGDRVEHIKEGDIVRYDKHAGHGIEWDDIMYYVITINDIVLVE
jgi:co-chaperonin GroES (HSP10)